ncbi:MAG: ATP-binding protein [Clostridia bacterium]|nr:ATP-binding protein [Clostridia bacterium]
MAYASEVYEAVDRELGRRRVSAQQKVQELRARMRRDPRVCELEQIMANSARKLTFAIMKKDNYEAELAAIEAENLAAQQEIAALMKAAGETATDFRPQYTCKLCEDTGYVDRKTCACRQALLRQEAAMRLHKTIGMKPVSFDDIDLTFYSEAYDERLGCSVREHMKSVIEYCRAYATGFHPSTRRDLLMRGATGIGKTHVSLAMAARACESGANVIYGSAQTLFGRLEAEHFGRAVGNTEEELLSCDLLILDDLGTERSSQFYTSALYNLINTRQLANLPTIINTNLDLKAIQEHYGEQIASRLMMYEPLIFVGSDIRQQMLERRYR